MSRMVKKGEADIFIENPLLYGERLLGRFPKSRAELNAMAENLDAIAAEEVRRSLGAGKGSMTKEEFRKKLGLSSRVSNTRLPNRTSSVFQALKRDEKRFEESAQGGGGIDWLNVSLTNASITEKGWEIRQGFIEARNEAAQHNEKQNQVFLPGIAEPFLVHCRSVGQGMAKQPLLIHWNGLVIRYGKCKESYPKAGGCNGTVGIIEASGLICLKLGESALLERMRQLCQALGIEIRGCRATRLDLCADLADCDISHFGKAVDRGHVVTFATETHVHYQRGKCTGITARTNAITMNAYEKLVEIKTSGDVEKLELMRVNRWGGEIPEKAVRVEFQFSLGHLTAMKFSGLEELFEGLGYLVEWACNDWFRLCEVNNRKNSARAPIVACWMRVTHAFAWFAGRFNKRPTLRPVQPQQPHRMAQQIRGMIASLLVRMGYRVGTVPGRKVVVDESTGWDILAEFFEPGELLDAMKKCAIDWDARRGAPEAEQWPEGLSIDPPTEAEWAAMGRAWDDGEAANLVGTFDPALVAERKREAAAALEEQRMIAARRDGLTVEEYRQLVERQSAESSQADEVERMKELARDIRKGNR